MVEMNTTAVGDMPDQLFMDDVPRGRWAPSPTGPIHIGNARTALLSWLSIRSQGGQFVWRTEDIDRDRVEPGLEEEAIRDLAWLGLDWDEGPDVGGPAGPYRQSERTSLYRSSLQLLQDAGWLFPCRVSRSELRTLASPPDGATPVYPAHLRPTAVPNTWWADHLSGNLDAAIRFRVEPGLVAFDDLLLGPVREDVSQSVGDFVLMRRDGVVAYQLAVVVDDLAMRVTEVVRGHDIAASTARQIQLFGAFGRTLPRFAHVPLIVDPQGNKLSKRNHDLNIQSLRDAGIEPDVIIGYLAYSCGLLVEPRPARPAALVDDFAWSRLRHDPWVVGANPFTGAGRRL